jgi:hypothetical protein
MFGFKTPKINSNIIVYYMHVKMFFFSWRGDKLIVQLHLLSLHFNESLNKQADSLSKKTSKQTIIPFIHCQYRLYKQSEQYWYKTETTVAKNKK